MDSELAEQVAYWEEQDKIHMALRRAKEWDHVGDKPKCLMEAEARLSLVQREEYDKGLEDYHRSRERQARDRRKSRPFYTIVYDNERSGNWTPSTGRIHKDDGQKAQRARARKDLSKARYHDKSHDSNTPEPTADLHSRSSSVASLNRNCLLVHRRSRLSRPEPEPTRAL